MPPSSPSDLKIIVLGAGAGGGVPQWNCNCQVCRLARLNDGRVLPRNQSSIAVSADDDMWCVFNCSPDIRQQISATPQLQPRAAAGERDTPIASVVLTNADVDHLSGLLVLREKQAFRVFATREVLDVLAENSIFNVLDEAFVEKIEIKAGTEFSPLPGLAVEPFFVPGKVALFKEQDAVEAEGELKLGSESGNTIGLRIRAEQSGRDFFYIPGCATVTADLAVRLRGARLLLFDGTVWQDDEMIARGLGAKSGQRMGHMSMAGADGSMAAIAGLDVERKVFIHINNSNPVLIEDSAERAEANAAGWEIAYDGMELTL